jgi:UDP-N-acetyl-D-mannosaminuronic acid transferase (WecB/TagA/CpsF family)
VHALKTHTILGVRFFDGSAREAMEHGLAGGLVVAPSAPSLLRIATDAHDRTALLSADLVLADSGFMTLLWRLRSGEKITRISGLEYLSLLLAEPALREPRATFWVMPNAAARDRNFAWLRSRGFTVSEDDSYLAPVYPSGAIEDRVLERIITERKPRHIIVALGGGVQERLGLGLRNRIPSGTGIHCIGAAIAFLSGEQAPIPMWADALFLGWFLRCLSAPRRFIPRYLKALQLASLVMRHGSELPPLREEA